MAIRVAPSAADLPADLAGRFLLLVRDADDTAAALAGLAAARDDLAALAGPGEAAISGVVLSPDGPLLRVGRLDADDEAMQTIPDLVRSALERAGLTDASLEVVEPVGAVDQLDRTPSAVVLRLFPRPAGADAALPLAWLEVAAEWVLGDATADETVALRLLGASFLVPAREAAATLHAAVGARAWCDLVHGRLDRRIRTASLTFGRAPHLALAAGGPGCDTSALLARFDLLREVARDVPEVAYACIDLEDTFANVGAGLGTAEQGWAERGGADPNSVVAQAGDLVVPDAFPFQLLGTGHRARLRERGNHELEEEGSALDDGRLELALGDPVDWLPRFETRVDSLELGTKALEDLLVTEAELAELAAGRPPADAGPGPTTTAAGGPDLDDVTLDAVPRPRRGLRLTLLELASWLAHEAHSDSPRSVSPVVAAYARWLASGLDHEARQALKPYAARLVGTRGPGLPPGPWRPLSPADARRADLAGDWLAREQAGAWLRLAGLGHHADALAKVRRLSDGSHRQRQLRLLEAALADLQRSAADGAAAASGSDVAWDAWERASEASGWVAASEAAWVGIPDAVASAAELRALEAIRLARGPAVEAVRAAALAAAASEAWRLSGEAGAAAVEARAADLDDTAPELMAAVPLSTAWERALQGAPARTGLDRDAVELAVEEAESTAQAILADLVDGGDPPAEAMAVARRAAAASGPSGSSGAVWQTVRELAAGVVGERAWAEAQAAAADTADRVVHRAAPVVDRAVLIAVAREVASLAARTAVATGGADSLAATADELRPEALALLDRLLERPRQGSAR